LRELALRKVNGANDWQIATTLYADFLLIILLSFVVGFMLINLLLPSFMEYTAVESATTGIYFDFLIYAALLMVCGFIFGGIPILFFRKRILHENIQGSGGHRSRNLFRKISLLVQLIISLGMIFCAAVFIKQIRFIYQTDLGIDRHNMVFIQSRTSCCWLPPEYAEDIKKIPGIIDAFPVIRDPWIILQNTHSSSPGPITGVNSAGETVNFTIYRAHMDNRWFDFFGVKLIEGELFPNERNPNYDNNKFLVNETAMREAGDIIRQNPNFVGVVRDFITSPTSKAFPMTFWYPPLIHPDFQAIAYKYEDGMREQVHDAVIQWYHNAFPDQGNFSVRFTYVEDFFDDCLKSEKMLLAILSAMGLACIIIAVFGVYSLTSFTCQQRRKEIAIRKINGAEVLDIMNSFFKEYLVLLALAALVAFPAGYIIMKPWLEGYVKQTSMDAWLYVLIFLIVFIVCVFSIISMVWKAANQNPAEVVKSE
jgi:hypothetical protein